MIITVQPPIPGMPTFPFRFASKFMPKASLPLFQIVLEKSSERLKKKSRKTTSDGWGAYALDLLKYPFALVLFNVSLYMFIKTQMLNGRFELVLKETTPSFY